MTLIIVNKGHRVATECAMDTKSSRCRPGIQIDGAIAKLRDIHGRPCFALWVSKQFCLGRGSCSCRRADQALTKDEWRPSFIER